MYSLLLLVHSWLRWAVLAAGIAAVVRGGAGEGNAGKWYTILLDTQMLIGLLLYFVLSPLTTAALGDCGTPSGRSPPAAAGRCGRRPSNERHERH